MGAVPIISTNLYVKSPIFMGFYILKRIIIHILYENESPSNHPYLTIGIIHSLYFERRVRYILWNEFHLCETYSCNFRYDDTTAVQLSSLYELYWQEDLLPYCRGV